MRIEILKPVLILLTTVMMGCDRQVETDHPINDDANDLTNIELSNIDGVSLKRLDSVTTSIIVTNDGGLRAHHNLFEIISFVAPDVLVVNEATLPDGLFLLEISPPASTENTEQHIRTKLIEVCANSFRVAIESVERNHLVFVIRNLDSGLVNATTANGTEHQGWNTGGSGFEFRNQTFSQLADFLANEIDRFVFDETKNTKPYNFELPIDVFATDKPGNWNTALNSIGLQLQPENRKVRFTMIENIEAN